jgi:murein DD-endopeptidase MepM/ murein hydrolase activator NlpD
VGGNWNGLPLTFVPVSNDPNRLFAYLPVPALIAPNAYWLTITYTATNGTPLSQSWPVAVAEGPYDRQEINLPDDRGGLLAADIIAPELEKVSAVWSQRSPTLLWTEVFSRPISPEYPTTSPFGTRRSYNGGPYASYHEGQDFGVPAGVPVLAPGAGVVALAESLAVRGNAVILDHGSGVFSGYWHLSEVTVAVGQNVAMGDVIGISGNTGLSTGAHLHWELRIYGIAVDPMQFIDAPLIAP